MILRNTDPEIAVKYTKMNKNAITLTIRFPGENLFIVLLNQINA
jgi:hypothetical protein